MGWGSLALTLGPSFNFKRRELNLKVLITRLLLGQEVCNVQPTNSNDRLGIFRCGQIPP